MDSSVSTVYVQNLNEKVNQSDLKSALYAAFSQFGKILQVTSAKTYKLRGQAWVIFEERKAAQSAINYLNGFTFYDKPLCLSYAHSVSDVFLHRSGVSTKRSSDNHAMRKADSQAKEKATRLRAQTGSISERDSTIDTPSSRIIRVQGLPATTTDSMLQILFEQFPGFEDARLTQGADGVARVQFQLVEQATIAFNGLQGFRLNPTHTLALSYVVDKM